ncbi:hypothetical protein [Ciceribacter selenitireducens]|uniref:Uncharacterized protein n=1 Tax=Ciceribacter selenitireducens ATCC BAA-1503 TaxID=1336235 RepID=A0A376AAT5_9HYPH|nr:hypothetical protein [Ciceribacter selenitireducens]SSC64884.1 unnamed protein product [Ciceribacter selenitireducens ATCC BAA-1503]
MLKIIICGVSAGLLAMTPAMASHNNPWATAEDTVLEKYHDENQAKSEGTPGEDEMYGGKTGVAFGKTGVSATKGKGTATTGGASSSKNTGAGRGSKK